MSSAGLGGSAADRCVRGVWVGAGAAVGSVTALQAAQAAAEAVRALVHATIPQVNGYAFPSDVDAVLGELMTLVERLPQALDQAEEWLQVEVEAGRVGDDRGRDPFEVVEVASAALTAARVETGAGGVVSGCSAGVHLAPDRASGGVGRVVGSTQGTSFLILSVA